MSSAWETLHVIRGACWGSDPWFARVADHSYGTPYRRNYIIGLRLARRGI